VELDHIATLIARARQGRGEVLPVAQLAALLEQLVRRIARHLTLHGSAFRRNISAKDNHPEAGALHLYSRL
jgi:hypothetical protein